MMKKVMTILFAVLLAVVFCTGCSKPDEEETAGTDAAVAAEKAGIANAGPVNTAEAVKLEGPGYDTPEDAVKAYLDAMNRGNAMEMLSTFAIETYVDHAEPENYILRMRSVSPMTNMMANSVPVTGDYSRSLLTATRFSYLANRLLTFYANAALPLEGMTLSINDADTFQRVQDALAGNIVDRWPGHVEFVEWVSPAAFPKLLYPGNNANRTAQNLYWGADDMTIVGARIRLNGEEAIQTMACARYGNRWYNMDLYNQVTSILGIAVDVGSSGLIPMNSEIAETLAAEPEAEMVAKLKGWETSGLSGTRWRLVALDQSAVQKITVAETKDGIRERDGMCVWAEMRLQSLGGFRLDIHFSPAMDEILRSEGYPNLTLYSAWSVGENGEPQLDWKVAGLQIRTFDMTDVTFERTADTITITWPWGMRAEFRKITE